MGKAIVNRLGAKRKAIPVGFRSNRIEVICEIPHPPSDRKKYPSRYVSVKCDCGTIKPVRWDGVKSGVVQSCGCLRDEKVAQRMTTHGECRGRTKTSEYSIWACMVDRCQNKNSSQYHDYGGRGISIEWESFDDFLSDMGRVPKGLTIERIDTNGNYCKGNCCWATRSEQNKNTRASKFWYVKGVKYGRADDAAVANNVGLTTILGWCDGYTAKGIKYKGRDDCWSTLKYPKPE